MTTMTMDDELLVKALPSGQILMMNAGQIGDFVRAGTFDYFDEANPAVQAQAIEALERLVGRGLVRHETGKVYKLTGSGFQRAKECDKQ